MMNALRHYKQEAKFTSYAILISVLLGIFWTLVFYPAVVTFDGMVMWKQAQENSYIAWYPPIMPMLMHVTLLLSGSVALFSFLQAFLFTFSLILLLREVIKNNRILFIAIITMLVALPSLWIYPVILLNNVWVSTFAMFSAVFFVKAMAEPSRKNIFLGSGYLSLAIAFRHEAFFYVLIPIILLQFLYTSPLSFKQIGKRFLEILLIFFICIAPQRFTEHLPTVEVHQKPTGAAFINQYIGTIHFAQKSSLSADDLNSERQTFDQIFGIGSLDQALSIYECWLPDMLWQGNQRMGHPAAVSIDSLIENQKFILKEVEKIASKYPIAFLHHRLCNLSGLLQISRITIFIPRLNEKQTQPHTARFRKFGLLPRSYFPHLRQGIIRFISSTVQHPKLNWLYRHYPFIGLAALLLIASPYLRSWEVAIPAAFSIVGLTCYLIIDGFAFSRYLLPSYVFSWIAIFAFFDYLYRKLTLHRG